MRCHVAAFPQVRTGESGRVSHVKRPAAAANNDGASRLDWSRPMHIMLPGTVDSEGGFR